MPFVSPNDAAEAHKCIEHKSRHGVGLCFCEIGLPGDGKAVEHKRVVFKRDDDIAEPFFAIRHHKHTAVIGCALCFCQQGGFF